MFNAVTVCSDGECIQQRYSDFTTVVPACHSDIDIIMAVLRTKEKDDEMGTFITDAWHRWLLRAVGSISMKFQSPSHWIIFVDMRHWYSRAKACQLLI